MEHDPEEIWQTSLATCLQALKGARLAPQDVSAIGITNQRETTIIWDRQTGVPVYRAIVWQDRRTSEFCNQLREAGHSELVTGKTGLLIAPYFSATKINWILENVNGARQQAESGRLAFGTVDSFLLWRLTGGRVHATDATNAARTMIFNIHDNCWDQELLDLFQIPASLLPEVHDCSSEFGQTDSAVLGAPIPEEQLSGRFQRSEISYRNCRTSFNPHRKKLSIVTHPAGAYQDEL